MTKRTGQLHSLRQTAGIGSGRKLPVDCYEDALRMLERRSRTAAELRQRLGRRGHAPAAVDATIARLATVGLLDDEAYARQFARTRLAAGRAAPSRLERELVRRGLDRQTAAAALQDVLTEDAVDVAAILDEAVRRRMAMLAKLDAATRRRRLFAYLARRGFDAADIRSAIERALARVRSDAAGCLSAPKNERTSSRDVEA